MDGLVGVCGVIASLAIIEPAHYLLRGMELLEIVHDDLKISRADLA